MVTQGDPRLLIFYLDRTTTKPSSLKRVGEPVINVSTFNDRDSHVRNQIEENAPNKEKFSTVAKVVNAGVALLVYARDDGIGRKVCDVQTAWTGSGPGYMGNKGAVGIRFRIPDEDGGVGETYTFVCAHLTAHEHYLQARIADFHHIVGTLLFPPIPGPDTNAPSTLYETSHLFFAGDLNSILHNLRSQTYRSSSLVTQCHSILDPSAHPTAEHLRTAMGSEGQP
ncbi:hypothetical protein PM082_013421 [Marasmius tenuissimus]|nr:hypothetical protein PM082_013421 [Marasmius tenuissimus]